jgi:2-(1,2-epoxy-1,2-dihydrophenyl)acetyl-CoA isomerase
LSEPVLLTVDAHVATITMNCPESMNAMTTALVHALCDAIDACEQNDDVRAVILTGVGRAFCAGGDLHAIEGFTETAAAADYVREAGRAAAAVFHSKKPYIAAVNGAAAGAGMNLAITCDFVLAAANAKFTQAFSSVGLASDCGGHFLLSRLVGPMKAKELIMLPRTLSADEAQSLGIVLSVEAPDALADAAAKLARELASRPPLALAETKRILNTASFCKFDKTMREEEQAQSRLAVSRDAKEGIRAFFEKRGANFTGE